MKVMDAHAPRLAEACREPVNPCRLAEKIAAGQLERLLSLIPQEVSDFTPQEAAHLTKGFAEYQRSAAGLYDQYEGAKSLEDCLGLEKKDLRDQRLTKRDQAIQAAMQCLKKQGRSSAAQLARDWESFVHRLWPAWNRDAAPPESACELHRHLYWATEHNRGRPLGAKQIGNLLSGNF